MIEADALTKRYGPATVVDRVSFTARPGVVTGFVGPNGAGKSTVLRMVVGLAAPSAGRALVSGRPYAHWRHPLRHLGALLDPGAVDPARDAYTHLRILARANAIGEDRVVRALEMVGLAGAARQPAGGYSLGMRQRLGIAAAVLGDPPVLIFDEPVNGLDPDGIVWIRELLRTFAAEGRTVVIASHQLDELALTAEHLIVIGGGRLLADCPVTDLTGGGRSLVDAYRDLTAGSVRFHGSGVAR